MTEKDEELQVGADSGNHPIVLEETWSVSGYIPYPSRHCGNFVAHFVAHPSIFCRFHILPLSSGVPVVRSARSA
jgi:hypothetical protein